MPSGRFDAGQAKQRLLESLLPVPGQNECRGRQPADWAVLRPDAGSVPVRRTQHGTESGRHAPARRELRCACLALRREQECSPLVGQQPGGTQQQRLQRQQVRGIPRQRSDLRQRQAACQAEHGTAVAAVAQGLQERGVQRLPGVPVTDACHHDRGFAEKPAVSGLVHGPLQPGPWQCQQALEWSRSRRATSNAVRPEARAHPPRAGGAMRSSRASRAPEAP